VGGFVDDDVGGAAVGLVDVEGGDESPVTAPESGTELLGFELGLVSVDPLVPVGLPIESSVKSVFKQWAPALDTGPRTIAIVLANFDRPASVRCRPSAPVSRESLVIEAQSTTVTLSNALASATIALFTLAWVGLNIVVFNRTVGRGAKRVSSMRS